MTMSFFTARFRKRGIDAVDCSPSSAELTRLLTYATIACLFAIPAMAAAGGSTADDRKVVAALDTEYQKAVKENDAKTMSRILADDFILVEGDGKHSTKADLVTDAKLGKTHYEHQEDTEQTVRIWGDTAVVTAKLWVKGIEDGGPVDYVLWFSDTYVRTPRGWRYVFGQASLPIPKPSR